MTRKETDHMTISRRSLLAGLAASTAATAAHSAPDAAECPDLIALGDALPALSKAHLDAVSDVEWIIAEWQPHAPTPDMDLVQYGAGTRRYETIAGRGVMARPYLKSPYETIPNLATAEVLESDLASALAEAERKAKTPSKRGLKWALRRAESIKPKIEPARAYWAEFDRIKEASGIEAAQAKVTHTREALQAQVSLIMAAEERTITGVVIKAQALAEWSKVDWGFRAFNKDAPAWSDQIAAAIMRQAGAA